MNRSDFAAHVGSDFAFRTTGETVDLRLEEVTDHACPPGYESFSVFFCSPPDALLHQGSYLFDHASLGEQMIFIVPIGPTDAGYRYEAVFNRKLQAPEAP